MCWLLPELLTVVLNYRVWCKYREIWSGLSKGIVCLYRGVFTCLFVPPWHPQQGVLAVPWVGEINVRLLNLAIQKEIVPSAFQMNNFGLNDKSNARLVCLRYLPRATAMCANCL